MELDEQIEIAAYDPVWPDLFDTEKLQVKQALEDFAIQIEHFGGTAVPGLDGRPVIDILVGVRRIELTTRHLTNLLALGYDEPGGGSAPRRFYLRKRGKVNVDLGIVPWDGTVWNNYLVFRDHLRADSKQADEYARLKRRLFDGGATTLTPYINQRRPYMTALMKRALDWWNKETGTGD